MSVITLCFCTLHPYVPYKTYAGAGTGAGAGAGAGTGACAGAGAGVDVDAHNAYVIASVCMREYIVHLFYLQR